MPRFQLFKEEWYEENNCSNKNNVISTVKTVDVHVGGQRKHMEECLLVR